MLFVCFFPQILSGPISRADELLPQIKQERQFDYSFAIQGLRWLLWGMFLKVVFADRLALYVNPVLDNYREYSGISIALASICYSLQIYGDFAGYSYMAIGVARLMGFDLINNFNRPYFATSVSDFWKRWHISLTRWLTTHVYIALGGNRCSKLRQYANIIITFLVSGIWHGANWTFIVWGLIHSVILIIEKVAQLNKKYTGITKYIRIFITFIIITFTWVFFRMPSLEDAFSCINAIFTNSGSLYLPRIDELCYCLLVFIIVFSKDFLAEFLQEKYNKMISRKWIRHTVYVVLLLIIVVLGVFNAGNFIYLQF